MGTFSAKILHVFKPCCSGARLAGDSSMEKLSSSEM